jgi:hypothetical protein
MQTRTYTINVPGPFPDVDSDKAARMLEAALAQGVELAPDVIGSGPKALRVTVSENDAEALRALAGGASMASAFRRLFSTVAGVRPVRALPAPGSAKRGSARLSLPAPETSLRVSRIASLSVPAWFDPANPNRGNYWRSLGLDAQQRMVEAHGPERASAPRDAGQRPRLGAALLLSLAFVLFFFMLPVLARFVSMQGKPGASGLGGAAAGPRFPEWRPQ